MGIGIKAWWMNSQYDGVGYFITLTVHQNNTVTATVARDAVEVEVIIGEFTRFVSKAPRPRGAAPNKKIAEGDAHGCVDWTLLFDFVLGFGAGYVMLLCLL